MRRQQTLLASVDWSHALLTQPERILFRRLAVFVGGFDLDAAQFVCGGNDVQRYQVLDDLTLLVDKSLLVADNTSGLRDTGYSKLFVSSPPRSSASPATPTPSALVTATITRRWQLNWTRPRQPLMSNVLTEPRRRSTTCGRPSGGAAKTRTRNSP